MRTLWLLLSALGTYGVCTAEESSVDIGYASVAAALEGLRGDSHAQFSEQRGWTVVASRERDAPVQWFFTPQGHAAHPAVVKRTAAEQAGVGMIELVALCHAEQVACDRLLDDFRQQHELEQTAARRERVTIDVGIALDDHERMRVERLLAEEGMAAEIRLTEVLKVVVVPTLGDDGRVVLWTAVYEFDGGDYALLGQPQLMSPGTGVATLEMMSSSGSRFGFSLGSLVARAAE